MIRVLRTVDETRKFIKRQRQKLKIIGFVPTMGYLHEGHLSLMREARQECDTVVISIFVNPLQFGPKEDYKRYPRDFNRDRKLAESVGVDAIFYPLAKEMYKKRHSTYVEVTDITERLCGKSRPGHFKGVTTVVVKLFNIVQPDVAYFGQKDAQQAIVIKRMVRDLNMNLKIKVLPIIREPDGLAMSSRNIYLSPKQRKDAVVLYESLRLAKRLINNGVYNTKKIKLQMKQLIESKSTTRIDYISITDLKDLKELDVVKGPTLIALAVWVGKARLIDNVIIGGSLNVD